MRYNFRWSGDYVRYKPSEMIKNNPVARPGEVQRFECPKKLILQRHSGTNILGTLDNEGYYGLISTVIVRPKTDYFLKYILSLLNSKIITYWSRTVLTTPSRSIRVFRNIPIKKASLEQQKPFVELADKMLSLNKQKNELLNLFKDLIKKFRQDEKFKPLSDYYTTKKSISLEDYTEDRAHRENEINKYRLNIVKSQELIDYKEVGKITKIDCEEKGNFLILRVRLEGEKDFRELLKIYFEDELMMQFFHFSIKTYLLEKERKKYWSKERIWEVLDEIKIPRSVPNVDTDARNIKQLMKTFEEAYMEKLSEEFKESQVKELNLNKIEEEIEKTDNQIDQKVYALYGLAEEEIGIIEKSV